MELLSSVVIISAVLLSQASAEDCKLRDNCECVYPDGTGYNLKPVISDKDDFLKAITDQNLTFYYHPCGDTKNIPAPPNATDECKYGYSLCMLDKTNNKLIVLGKTSEMEFRMNGDDPQVLFIKPNTLNRSSITLQCTEKAKTSVLYAPIDVDPNQVNLVLFSPNACLVEIDKIVHHGFFYTFFIVLMTLLFVYLFIGILINYFFIGARGYELIPNYDWWCKIWLSTKLGFIYVKNGCRVIPTEDSYDAI